MNGFVSEMTALLARTPEVLRVLLTSRPRLIGMREQARSIGAHLAIRPGRQRGTTVALTVSA